jgi:hypothetical protein
VLEGTRIVLQDALQQNEGVKPEKGRGRNERESGKGKSQNKQPDWIRIRGAVNFLKTEKQMVDYQKHLSTGKETRI